MSNEDRFGFFQQDYDEKELGEGRAAFGPTPKQWALVEIERVEAVTSKVKGTAGLEMDLILDKTYALTPGRKVKYMRSWCSANPGKDDKYYSWNSFRRLSVAMGLGSINLEPTKENCILATQGVAAMAKGRKFIVRFGVDESGDEDRSDMNDFYPATEENLAAIMEAEYGFKSVKVKKREEDGRKRSYLVAGKAPAAGSDASPAAASSIN